ncbi:uncharacterized protein LOC108100513 [Drosophila ficusphila]|uniref:uncharacterized protein LOC108100513 n=1 Tax=Drosophila ficusphila TaxID=30025 RepID=UPI0007E73005|nr:uncharacterized protein LOC108100513 [Drosophila ficusphila]
MKITITFLVLILSVFKNTWQHDDHTIPGMRNKCGNCSGLKTNNDRVTGFYCHPDDKVAVTRKYFKNESAFPECVPKIYDITHAIKNYCCFWSPNLGCSILVNEKSENLKVGCSQCDHHCYNKKSGAASMNFGQKCLTTLSLIFFAYDLIFHFKYNSEIISY